MELRFSIINEVDFYEAKPPVRFWVWRPLRGVFWGKVGYGQINSVRADHWICRATSVLGEIRHRERREERSDEQDSKVTCLGL